MPIDSTMLSERHMLARKINDALGRDAIVRLYNALTDDEYNLLQELLEKGEVNLHNDGFMGFSINAHEGWTSECFVKE